MTGISSYPGNQYPVAYQPAQPVRFADRVASDQAHHAAHQGPPSKSGKGWSFGESVYSFFAGGAKNVISGIFSWNGLMTIGAGVALTIATGGAATPFLIAGGLAMAGVTGAASAAKAGIAFANNDVDSYHEALEGAGASTISAGLGVLAARSYYASGAKATVGGKAVTLAEEAPKNPLVALYKDMRGQLTRDNGQTAWQGLKTNSTELFNTRVAAAKSWWTGANKPIKFGGDLAKATPEDVTAFLKDAATKSDKLHPDMASKLTPEALGSMDEAGRLNLARQLDTHSELFMLEKAAGNPGAVSPQDAAAIRQSLTSRQASLSAEETAQLQHMTRADATPQQLRAAQAFLEARPVQVDQAAVQSLVTQFTGKGKLITPADVQAAIKEAKGDASLAQSTLQRMDSFNGAYRGFLTEKYGADFKLTNAHRVTPEALKSFGTAEEFAGHLAKTYENLGANPQNAPFTFQDAASQGYNQAGKIAGTVKSRFAKAPAAGQPNTAPTATAEASATQPVPQVATQSNNGPTIHQFRQSLINDGSGIQHGMVGKTLGHEFHNPGTLGSYGMGGAYAGRFLNGGGSEEYYAPEGPQVVGFDPATQQPIFQHAGT